MKKMIPLMLIACLLLGGLVGYLRYQGGTAPETAAPAPAPEAPAETAAPAPAPDIQMEDMDYETLDIKRLRAAHDPQETVLSVDGKAESWGDYFYFLASQINEMERLLVRYYANYGAELLWSDTADADGNTFADLALSGAEKGLLQLTAIEGFAAENAVELTEESRQDMARQLASDMKAYCGEAAMETAFDAYLAAHDMNRSLYDRILMSQALYREGFHRLYGDGGELLEEETALRYLEDNGYISANHILLATVDPLTGEKLEEAVIAEKADAARRLAAELQAIEDPAERLQRFAQFKEAYCEDAGKTIYPEGYTFTPHTMAADFERVCKELEPYAVSDPVQSNYGYHIIMKLPPDADALLFNSSGDPITARAAAASIEYDERLQAYTDGLKMEYAEGFEKPNLLDYING
ncbi:MAG: peptidylprolyl isomerase [Oscillospiraceae bacterium]|nr:peptidylprolyl isomerase [Oscillospiraceae bacterium]